MYNRGKHIKADKISAYGNRSSASRDLLFEAGRAISDHNIIVYKQGAVLFGELGGTPSFSLIK
jgi:hypothetical protein